MPNFKGNSSIIIQPGDSNIPYAFQISVCSSTTANDGYIPYGTSVSSVVVTATTDDDDRTVVDDIIDNYTVNNNIITVYMSYPSTSGDGRYRLRFLLTLDNGSIIEADFGRIRAKNI